MHNTDQTNSCLFGKPLLPSLKHELSLLIKVAHNTCSLVRIRHAHLWCSIAALLIMFKRIFQYKLLQARFTNEQIKGIVTSKLIAMGM